MNVVDDAPFAVVGRMARRATAYIRSGHCERGAPVPKLPFSGEEARRLLEEALQGVTGPVGVAVTDLGTGTEALIRPDRPFPAASVAKIPIAMAVLHLVTEGRLSLDDLVTYDPDTDYEGGAGSLRYTIQPGDQFPISLLLDRMIVVSDNIARNMLERYIGPGTVRDYMLAQGVEPPYNPAAPRMTARGTNQLLLRLDGKKAGISPELTQFLLNLLSNTVYNDRIPAKLPPDVTVAHKVGTLSQAVHDAGLVYAPDRSFAISVFTEEIPYDEAINLIATLARTIYDYEDRLVREGGDP